MPIHDWTRVPARLFHHFHQDWTIEIARALNRGLLPAGLSALVEQRAGNREGDVLGIESRKFEGRVDGGLLTTESPTTSILRKTNSQRYAARANRVVVRHHLGRIVAVIEIASPGNKDGRAALREFVEKSVEFIDKEIHLLIVDLFPPSPRDPLGIHKLIWDEFVPDVEFEFPTGKDRILASYDADEEKRAFVEPIGVGDPLPNMALFIEDGCNVRVPLDTTYRSAWDASPSELRLAVESGVLPAKDIVRHATKAGSRPSRVAAQ